MHLRISEKPRILSNFSVVRNGKEGLIVNVFAWTWHFWSGCTGNTSNQLKIAAFNEGFLRWLEGYYSHYFRFKDGAKTSEDCYR